jgi:phage/plasmid-associated DNA primase
MLYWYGEGGDGKGELSDLFFRNMGDTATPMSFGDFHSRFGGEPLIDRRFIRIDEVPKGNFMTDRVKEFTGGNKTLLIERKGKPHVIIKSRLAFMFTSNNKPSFDGSMAQKRRLRYIESLPRVDKARDVQSELDASFDVFLAYCLINYARHGSEIPENDPLVLADLMDDTMSPIDYWIKTHLEYAPGERITNDDIRRILESETPYAKFSLISITRRLAAYFKPDEVLNFPVTQYRETDARRLRGWHNIQPKNRIYGGINLASKILTERE